MTSETPNLHVSKNLNISKTKQDIEKLKTPLRLVWKCCSDPFKIGSTIFCRRGTLTKYFCQHFYQSNVSPLIALFSTKIRHRVEQTPTFLNTALF